jgi:hypothetical protein
MPFVSLSLFLSLSLKLHLLSLYLFPHQWGRAGQAAAKGNLGPLPPPSPSHLEPASTNVSLSASVCVRVCLPSPMGTGRSSSSERKSGSTSSDASTFSVTSTMIDFLLSATPQQQAKGGEQAVKATHWTEMRAAERVKQKKRERERGMKVSARPAGKRVVSPV